jgi:hypothetical protein
MRPRISLRDALTDAALLGHVLRGPSWLPWRVVLVAAMGEALTDEERPIFTKLTSRAREPLQRVSELEVVAGRRGGKTTAMAAGATYIAACCDHTDALARGETGVLLCVAQDQRVAKKILDFCEANLSDSEILRQLIKGRTQDTIELTNNINIEVRPASFRKLRGPTYVAIIADELAFWFTDASFANPDIEVLAAVRPGLLTTGGPLIMASSPYAKMGVLWDTFRKHFGPDGAPSVLVAKGTTRDFNQTIPQGEIDRELERDRARNTAELLAEFRSDLESFVSVEVVESCIGSYYEMGPAAGVSYYGFTDPSGGSDDSFTLSISHRDGERVVIDARARGTSAAVARGRHRRVRAAVAQLPLPSCDRRPLRRRVSTRAIPQARYHLQRQREGEVGHLRRLSPIAQFRPRDASAQRPAPASAVLA